MPHTRQQGALEFLKDLNSEQLQAVTTNNKPLMIIAGAGSGKTKVIASKIVLLLNEGLAAENILALTFTQKATEEMVNRVSGIMGNVNDLQIFTFHSFCNQFLLDNILETTLNANFGIINDIAQLVYFVKNINSFGLEYLKFTNNSHTLAQEVKQFISKCKDEFISNENIIEYIEKRQIEPLSEEEKEQLNILKDISKMSGAYENYKREQNMIDFGDMLFIVYDVLRKNKRILDLYQSKFKYVMVDEFQDTNFVQLQIVNLLTAKHRQVCVVGDDDQSIYKFRGAYVTNISEFKRLYPEHIEISLTQNYRSTKNILETANLVISDNPDRLEKKLRTEREAGDKISVIECDSDISQTLWIVENIQEISKQMPLGHIAVLCRSRTSALPIASELKKRRIAYEFLGNSDLFSKGIIKDMVALLKVVNNPVSSNGEMVRILERDIYSLRKTDVAKLGNLAHTKMCGIYESLDFIDEIDVNKERFLAVKKLIDNLMLNKNKLDLTQFIYTILFNYDFYKYEIQLDNRENIYALNTFYKFAADFIRLYPYANLSDFVSYVEFASGFEIESEEENYEQDCVKIMTVHSAKGKEFPVVFVIDAVEKKFPSINRSDKFRIPQELLKGGHSTYSEKDLHIHEERRLFYVAITRAKDKLCLSYAKRYNDNITDSKPSRFITSIGCRNSDIVTFEIMNKKSSDRFCLEPEDEPEKISRSLIGDLRSENYKDAIEKILLLAKIKSANVRDIISNIKEPDYDKVETVVKNELDHKEIIDKNFDFSVSQFNTYERCPRIYEYNYIYRVPTKPKHYFDFGGTVHSVIEQLSKKIKNGEVVDMQIAENILKREWNPKGFESKLQEKQDLQEIMRILEIFIKEESNRKGEIFELEKDFTFECDDYIVTGRIDRIDKDGNDMIIVDYKTSKESFSAKKAMEDFQLVVYAIAAESMYSRRPSLVGWWFLRNNKKVMVTINQEHIEKIMQNLNSIVQSIRSGDFHATPGWVCKNCDYKDICDAAKL
jgi:DNA helicase-2/ATP-dependent DNA helicase PcrA